MTSEISTLNRVRQRRLAAGLTQAELATRAGISRTAVTAIEGDRLVPSVAAALSLAAALDTTVEQLFGQAATEPPAEVWAWNSTSHTAPCWQAEISGKVLLYPADSTPMFSMLPDRHGDGSGTSTSAQANETLVMACCDPAAGMLASQFASTTGLRLIVLPRSSRQAVEMLREGKVHLAGLHLATRDHPQRNTQVVHSLLGTGFQFIRMAWWQEGIAVTPTTELRSVRAVIKSKLNWIGREPGSGARQCLDQLLGDRAAPRRVARDHRGVVEAIRSGWADAGICVQLASAEAGLKFLPVQEEAFDVCFPTKLADDRRIKAFLSVVRSVGYRKLLGDLPGYDARDTGNVWEDKA